MKKSIIIFVIATALSVGMVIYGCVFLEKQIGEATLTEETISGDRTAVEGLNVGFRADSGDNLHWVNSFEYSGDRTRTSFKRGDMTRKTDHLIYDDIRFTGWSTTPFCTQLDYNGLDGIQNKNIQAYYNNIQQKVMLNDSVERGKIRLKDYLDYYPISFRFQFGITVLNSSSTLTGLKIYDENGSLSPENTASYDNDVNLYTTLNNLFKIPVLDNEYQQYKVSKVKKYNSKTSLGYKTGIKRTSGAGEDYYEFDPIIVIQEENIIDGKKWVHPDLTGGLSYEIGGDNAEDNDSNEVKKASDYNLKNRMLFTVNNRTAKGAPVDVSQIGDGYGVYELPIEVTATATVKRGRRSWTVANPKPLTEELKMVYPLDKEAEYVEMSLSDDHRYLAVFSVKEGKYFVEIVDADNWTSNGPVEIFPALEKMTYAWGEDGSLAITNHDGYVAVLTRTNNENMPYEIIYDGKTEGNLDNAFFDSEMIVKMNAHTKYSYCVDSGLAVASKEGKVALVQNSVVGNSKYGFRNAELECAVLDKSGVIYRGRLKSNIVDVDSDVSGAGNKFARNFFNGKTKDEADSKTIKNIIKPVQNENWCKWKTSGEH